MREKIGNVAVDSGGVFVGDPCYFLHKGKQFPRKDLGKNWLDFCKIMEKKGQYENGYSVFDSGISVQTTYGDGEYGVYAEYKDGKIVGLYVDLAGDYEDEDYNSEYLV